MRLYRRTRRSTSKIGDLCSSLIFKSVFGIVNLIDKIDEARMKNTKGPIVHRYPISGNEYNYYPRVCKTGGGHETLNVLHEMLYLHYKQSLLDQHLNFESVPEPTVVRQAREMIDKHKTRYAHLTSQEFCAAYEKLEGA